MNRLITLLAFILTALVNMAQSNRSVSTNEESKHAHIIKVEYDYHYFTMRGYEVERPMILKAGHARSKFYNPITDWIDSLCCTPEGRARYKAMCPDYGSNSDDIKTRPVRWEKMFVEIDKTHNILRRYDTVGDDRFYYEEELPSFEWEICDSTKAVLDYECVMAENDYHGRHWTVWFTPEIPLQSGPWKLSGLPGLILEAKESIGQYHFTATCIESIPGEISPIYEKEKYEKINRIELLRHKRFFDENMGIIISAQTSAKHLKPSQFKSLELKANLDYLETDYHQRTDHQTVSSQ